MTLRQFLIESGLSMAEFGRRAGIANRQSVCKYVSGRIPTKEVMQRIYLATGGHVTANDFFELPPLPKSESDAA